MTLTPRRALRAPLLTTLIAATPLLAFAQQVAVPAHVPSDIKAMLSINDTTAVWQSWASWPLSANINTLIQTPALQEDPDYQEYQLEMDKAELQLGFSPYPANLFTNVLNGLDLYITQPADQPAPQLLAVARAADSDTAAKIGSLISTQMDQVNEQRTATGLPAIPWATTSVEGVDVKGAETESIHYAVNGDLILISTGIAAIQDSLTSTGSDRLATNAIMQRGRDALGDTPGEVTFYLDTAEALKMARTMPGAPDLSNITSGPTYGTLDFSAQGIDITVFSGLENPSDARRELASIPPGTMSSILSFLDNTPIFAWAGNQMDGPILQKLTDEVPLDPAAAGQFQAVKTQIEAATGLSFEQDILPAFGPEIAFALQGLDMSGGFMPSLNALIALKISDADAANRVIDKFETQMAAMLTAQARQMNPQAPPVQPVVTPLGDTSLRTLPMGGGMMMPLPITLTHSVTTDGYWVLGLSDDTVRTAINTHRDGGQSLATVSAQSASAGTIPTEINNLSLVNFRQLATTVSQLVPLFAGFLGPNAADMDTITQAVETVGSLGICYMATVNDTQGTRGYGRLLLK